MPEQGPASEDNLQRVTRQSEACSKGGNAHDLRESRSTHRRFLAQLRLLP